MLKVTLVTLAFALVVLAVVSFSLWFTVRVAMEYHRFNEGIKDWAQNLDDEMRDSINRTARNILREMDERLQAEKQAEKQEDVENNIETIEIDE